MHCSCGILNWAVTWTNLMNHHYTIRKNKCLCFLCICNHFSQKMWCSPGTGMGTRRGQHHPGTCQLCDHQNFQNGGWEAYRNSLSSKRSNFDKTVLFQSNIDGFCADQHQFSGHHQIITGMRDSSCWRTSWNRSSRTSSVQPIEPVTCRHCINNPFLPGAWNCFQKNQPHFHQEGQRRFAGI